jgi:hypothetical protein
VKEPCAQPWASRLPFYRLLQRAQLGGSNGGARVLAASLTRMSPDLREPQFPQLSNGSHVSTYILGQYEAKVRCA